MTLGNGEPMVMGSPGRGLWRLVSVLASVGPYVLMICRLPRVQGSTSAREGFPRRHDVAA